MDAVDQFIARIRGAQTEEELREQARKVLTAFAGLFTNAIIEAVITIPEEARSHYVN